MSRIICVLKIIVEYSTQFEYISAKTIVELLKQDYNIKCNIKTIYNDIEKINQYFYEYYCIENYICSKHKRGYTLSQEVLSDGELRFLFDAIFSSHVISKNEGKILFDKICKLSSKRQLQRISSDFEGMTFTQPLFIKLNTIIQAIYTHKTLIFEYHRPQVNQKGQIEMIPSSNGNDVNNPKSYIVSPYEVMINSGKYYLLAYNSKRKEQLSIYRIDRMDRVRTSKNPFYDIRDMFDMVNLKSQAVNMFFSNEIIRLEFIFDSRILGSVLDQFGQSIKIKKDHTGKLHGVVEEAIYSEGLMGWLMMLGHDITIISPLSLREKMVERLEKMLSNYK